MDLVGCDYSHIPLPVATLAALTPDGVDIAIVDENVEPVPIETDADVIAFSVMLAQRERFLYLAAAFKEQGKFVVVGGPVTRLLFEECRNHTDAVFVGEGEYTWPQFIDDYRAGLAKEEYRQEGWVDMKDSPIPRFDLLKSKHYAGASVQASRGCPYSCTYCDVPVNQGSTPRSKPIEKVIQEVRQLSLLGFDSVFFVDDIFSANKIFAKKLLRALIDANPTFSTKMYYYTQDTLLVSNDEELLNLYFQAGFRRLFIGIETPNEKHLGAMSKKHNTFMDIRKSIEKIQSHGIIIWAGILFGLEENTAGDFEEQKNFILETGILPVQTGLLQAMPETALFEQMRTAGRLRKLPSVMGGAGLGDRYSGPTTNIVSSGLPEHELNSRFAVFLHEMFSPKSFDLLIHGIGRKVPNRALSTWPPITWNYLKTLFRTLGYYLFNRDRELRALFLKVLFNGISGRANNLDELLFHLVIYKHMKIFYGNLAQLVSLRNAE